MTEAGEIGPVEYLVVAFPGNRFRGEIAPRWPHGGGGDHPHHRLWLSLARTENGPLAPLDPEVREGLENLGRQGGLFNEEDLMAAGEELGNGFLSRAARRGERLGEAGGGCDPGMRGASSTIGTGPERGEGGALVRGAEANA